MIRYDQLSVDELVNTHRCRPFVTEGLEPRFRNMLGLQQGEKEGAKIYLLPGSCFDQIAPGTVLYSIFGNRRVAGTDKIDDDTRGGYLAYGVLEDTAKANGASSQADFVIPRRKIELDA